VNHDFKPLKLLILSDTAAPHTRRWANWFHQNGHEVTVVSLNPHNCDGYSGPAIVHIWKATTQNNSLIRAIKLIVVHVRLMRIIRRNRPDIIHAHSTVPYSWIAYLTRRPYIVTPWGTDLLVDAENSRINRRITIHVLKKARLVTTDGLHFIPILEQMGIPRSRILKHMFGTDTQGFSPRDKKEARNKLELPDKVTIISARTLNPVHDVQTFIDALPKVFSLMENIQVLVVGDGSEREKLQLLVSDYNLNQKVFFLGMLSEPQLQTALAASDIYVSTSLMDAGLAGGTAEAMATGLPVIHTDYGDNRSWTPEGEGGYLFPVGDSDLLSDLILRLLDKKDLAHQMGLVNRRRILTDNNIDIEMSKIKDAYIRVSNANPE
jgi:glycosyltransferase involved in cell wall biosynthesis